MTTANVSCPLDLPPTTIAAWRDGALSADESARIAAHVAGCAACQREVAMYESQDNALRRQPVPASDGRLWRAVRAGMTSNNRRPRNSGRTVRRMVGATSALAAVLLLSLGFAQLFQLRGNVTNHPTSTATAQGTPTPLPTAAPASPAVRGAPLPTWQSANFPTSGITFGEQSDDILTFGVAATDGSTAYSCYSQTNQAGSQLRIYRTSDRAVHWTQLVQFPMPHFQTSDCMVQVDTLDANRVLVNVLGQNTQTLLGISLNELTEDGGATWNKLPSSDILYGIATVNGRTYALRDQVVGQQSNGLPKVEHHLSVSTDHLRSWQPIDSGLVALGKSVTQFWARPDGELLAEVSTMAKNSIGILMPVDQSLWISHDGGAHWESFVVPLPANEALIPGIGFLVQLPTGNAPWRICASYSAPGDRSQVDGIVCTFDGGQSWSVRPILCTNAPCSASGLSSGNDTSLWALTADNSILLISPDSASHLGLYRLPPDSSQWQYLGPMTGGIFYIASARGGVLWQFAGGVYLGGFFSGNIGGHLGSLPSVLLSTASYP